MVKIEKTKQVIDALKNKYDDKGYSHAFLEQVGNATGWDCNRHADAIVVSLWKSRGLEIIGFEIKVSRSDWLKELRSPEKADTIAKYCHRWYLVVGDKDIVQFGELPMTWGLLVPHTKKTLKEVKPAVINENPEPVDMKFLCAILRQAQSQITDKAKLRVKYQEGYDDGKKEEKENIKDSMDWIKKDRDEVRRKINVFEKASGIALDDWRFKENSPGKIGEIVKSILDGTYMKQVEDFKWLQKRAQNIVDTINEEIGKIMEI